MKGQKAEPTADEIYKLVKENNHMLRAMRRNAFIGGLFKIVFWVVILIVIPYFSWLFLQPYFEGALNTYNQVQGSVETLNTAAEEAKGAVSSFPNFGDFFKQFGGGN